MQTFDPQSPPESLYLALDIDQFPAQAISAYTPSLQNRPFVVVRQNTDSHKSGIWACSTRAKAIGLKQGMSVRVAQKRHPSLEVVPRDEALEKTVCEELSWIVCHYSPEYEVRERGDGLVNLSETPVQRHMTDGQIAEEMKREIHYKIGLEEVAIGVSQSRLLARLLAKTARPDGIQTCETEAEEIVLTEFSTRMMPDLSGQCREKLKKYGIKRIGQIQRLGKDALVARFGKEGEKLYSMANGVDTKTAVGPKNALHAEHVLEWDINDLGHLIQNVRYAADKLCHELKVNTAWTNRMTFVLRYADNRTAQKTAAWVSPTNDFLTLSQVATKLFKDLYQRRVAVKSMKLMVTRPKKEKAQLGLFETDWEKKQRQVSGAITEIRKRMGFDTVVSASHLNHR